MTTHAVIITYLRDQTQPAVDAIGGFYRTCVLTGKALVRRPFHWREAIEQGWFITSVSLLPTLAVSIPLTVLIIFTLNILLAEFGAADISGAGAALGAVTQLGPLTTVLVPEVIISVVKSATFGLIAGLVGCYRGLTTKGGPKGVGTAVNETLVLCVIALFATNVVLTTIGVRFGTGH